MKRIHAHIFLQVLTLLLFVIPAAGAERRVNEDLCRPAEMESAIAAYRQLEANGGWPEVPGGATLREGEKNERIALIRQRLAASGDLAAPGDHPEVFDAILKEAVQKFQARHGLTTDGHVGIKTLRELNVSISDRIRQLNANLASCRQFPSFPESSYILVNIPDFTLRLYEDSKLFLSMPVIVGRTDRQTPVFSSRITTLILNPTWTVPQSIAAKDLLPKIKKNPHYLKKSNFRVLTGAKGGKEIDPSTIDWSSLSPSDVPYLFRQASGPANALGRVKFLLPNSDDIYLHDTPGKALFQKDVRAFSSGCIRLAKPLDLAVYLMQGYPMGSLESLTAAISRKKTQSLAVPSPMVVHIVYMTAWVEPDGTIQFRSNLYNREPSRQ
jgi:L,D-transpeptidase YcbB